MLFLISIHAMRVQNLQKIAIISHYIYEIHFYTFRKEPRRLQKWKEINLFTLMHFFIHMGPKFILNTFYVIPFTR